MFCSAKDFLQTVLSSSPSVLFSQRLSSDCPFFIPQCSVQPKTFFRLSCLHPLVFCSAKDFLQTVLSSSPSVLLSQRLSSDCPVFIPQCSVQPKTFFRLSCLHPLVFCSAKDFLQTVLSSSLSVLFIQRLSSDCPVFIPQCSVQPKTFFRLSCLHPSVFCSSKGMVLLSKDFLQTVISSSPTLPRWPSGKASAPSFRPGFESRFPSGCVCRWSQTSDFNIGTFPVGVFAGGVRPVTSTLVLSPWVCLQVESDQ